MMLDSFEKKLEKKKVDQTVHLAAEGNKREVALAIKTATSRQGFLVVFFEIDPRNNVMITDLTIGIDENLKNVVCQKRNAQ